MESKEYKELNEKYINCLEQFNGIYEQMIGMVKAIQKNENDLEKVMENLGLIKEK